MACAARIALARRWMAESAYTRLLDVLQRAGLPCTRQDLPVPTNPEAVLAALEQIRLIRDGHLRFVLPLDIGASAIADDVTDNEIRQSFDGLPGERLTGRSPAV